MCQFIDNNQRRIKMIKSICKAMFVLGLGSLTLAHAAPVVQTANASTDYRTYLDYSGVGSQTMDQESALSLFSSDGYFSVNEALQVEQLQQLIANQTKVMAKLGISSTPSWQSIDSTTNSLITSMMNKNDPFVSALISQHSLSQPLNGIPFISIHMNSYVANLEVLANQNEAAILAKLQSCSQGSLEQCVGE
jgi:hypothetical protein